MEIKLLDKLKALDMVNRHIGFYEEDNVSKATKINLNNLPHATLQLLLKEVEAD